MSTTDLQTLAGMQNDAAAAPVRQALLQEVTARETELLEASAATLAGLPGYRNLDSHDRSEAADSIRDTQRLLLKCLEEHRSLSSTERALLEDLGRKRADQGIPHESIDEVFGVVLEAALSALQARARMLDTGGQAFAVLASVTAELTQLVRAAGTAITHGYHRGLRRRESSETRLMAALLDGRKAPEGAARTTITGLVLVRPLQAGGDCAARTVLAELKGSVPGLIGGPVRQDPVIHAVAMLPDIDVQAVHHHCQRLAAEHSVVIVHTRVVDAAEAGERYRLVHDLLPMTAIAARGRPGLLPMSDLLATGLLARAPRPYVDAYITEVLGRLAAAPEGARTRALTTIDAFLQSGPSHKAVGNFLGIHRHTAANRIDQVEQLTGHSLESNGGLLRLALACGFLRIFPDLTR